ncbi:MAG: hypothetical protein Q8K92_12235 [Leadbetterella sp.]|nr:hypothetical protein [Leadbetterella sp.]
MNKAITECPRFKFCSSNVCPLDTSSHLRSYLDGEEKCKVSKSIRLRIGTKYELPRLGLKNSEWAGRQRFDNLSQEEKEKFIAEGSERLKTVNHRSSQIETPKDEPRYSPPNK